jgi:hypothetical protein
MLRYVGNRSIEPEDLTILQRVFDQLSAELPPGSFDPEDIAGVIIRTFQRGIRDEAELLAEARAACTDSIR